MDKGQRFAVADAPLFLDGRQQFRDAFDDILPPAVRNAEAQQRRLSGVVEDELRFQFREASLLAVRGRQTLHLGQRVLLIGPEKLLRPHIRDGFIASPFPAEQHLEAGDVAIFPGCGFFGKFRSALHARDVQQCLLLRLWFRLFFRLIHFMQQQRTDVLAAGAFSIFIERAGAAGADETAVLAQPCLSPVEVPAAAPHIGAQMAHAILCRLTFQILHAVLICLGPCIDRAAQQIADLFSVHVSALPLASVLLVKHTAPADQMQELWTKKAKRKRSKISLRAF